MYFTNTKPGFERIKAAQKNQEQLVMWAVRDCNKAGGYYHSHMPSIKKMNAIDRLVASGKLHHVAGKGYVANNHKNRAWVKFFINN